MSNVYMTSDPHLGHKNVTRFRSQFSSTEEHDEFILDQFRKLTKHDTLWVLGDVAFTKERFNDFVDLPCQKRVVLGNHDHDQKVKPWMYAEFGIPIYGLVSYKKAWLSHAPIHSQELRGRINLHGHVHEKTVMCPPMYADRSTIPMEDYRYINCCLENTLYELLTFQELLEVHNVAR